MVLEYTSRKTRTEDTAKKYEIYRDIWKAKEYFLFDPTTDYLKTPLLGFRLVDGKYLPIEMKEERLESQVLGLTIERNLRSLLFRETRTGRIVLSKSEAKVRDLMSQSDQEARRRIEAEREVERLQAELARLRNGTAK